MDAVVTNQQGNAQTGTMNSLVGLDHVLRRDMQKGSGVLVHHLLVNSLAGIHLHHLPDLLLTGHPAHEVIQPFIHSQVGIAIGHILRHSIHCHQTNFLSYEPT